MIFIVCLLQRFQASCNAGAVIRVEHHLYALMCSVSLAVEIKCQYAFHASIAKA